MQPVIQTPPSTEKGSQLASAGNITNQSKSSSYAATVSNDVSKTFKQALVETFNKHRKVERISTTATVHNLPENGKDNQDLQAVFTTWGYKAKILTCVRLNKASGKPKMLKGGAKICSREKFLRSQMPEVKHFNHSYR